MDTERTPTGDRSVVPECGGNLSGTRKGVRVALVGMVLTVLIVAVYLQVRNHGFLNYDTNVYVTENQHVTGGLTWKGIAWAFTSFYASNWHPITWLSHMVDVQLFGMNPFGHHLTSVAIHAMATLALFLFLFRVTGALWQSSLVAALFAIHPTHVESVAWVAERKDVLSAFFWFLTLIFYSAYATRQKRALYLLSLGSFVLGLMSKPMLVTLPVVMLMLDYWPLRRMRSGVRGEGIQLPVSGVLPTLLLKEKIPFLVCSFLSSVITIYAQHSGGAIQGLGSVPIVTRIGNALVAYLLYISKIVWPDDLAVLYPLPESFPAWQVTGSLMVLLLVSALTFRVRQRYPYLLVGWFWYLVTLLPVIGIIQVGVQSMADRYTYIPSIGLFIMVAWGATDLARGLKHRVLVLGLLAGAGIFAYAVVAWHQLGYWRDEITLYRRTLAVTTGNYVIHNNLGHALSTRWELDAAAREFREALRINPEYSEAHYNLGMALAMRGDVAAAIKELQEALRINPRNSKARFNLGLVLDQQRWQRENFK